MGLENKIAETAKIIKADGIGAGRKWRDLSAAAMGGDAESATQIAAFLGKHQVDLVDVWVLSSAAYECMTEGERDASDNEYTQILGAKANAATVLGDKVRGNKIGEMRRRAGLTQEQLAQRIGTSMSALQKLESGRTEIAKTQTRVVVAIARELGVPLETLVEGI